MIFALLQGEGTVPPDSNLTTTRLSAADAGGGSQDPAGTSRLERPRLSRIWAAKKPFEHRPK